MTANHVIDLSDCTAFRQSLEARAPRLVHMSLGLAVLTALAALCWSAVTEADLVVLADGRVRPIATPSRVYAPVEVPELGPVVGVFATVGDTVQKGQLLVQLDTQPLRNEIKQLEERLASIQTSIARLNEIDGMLVRTRESEHARIRAALGVAAEKSAKAASLRDSSIREATIAVDIADEKRRRLANLADKRVVAPQELEQAVGQYLAAVEKLNQAKLPVTDGEQRVLEKQLGVIEQETNLKRQELQLQITSQQAERTSAEKQLANLNIALERAAIRAPVDGVIVSGQVQHHDVVQPGAPVMEIAATDGFLFEAHVNAKDIGELAEGMEARIRFDAFDYQHFGTLKGRVVFVSPDSTSTSEHSGLSYTVRIQCDSHQLQRDDHVGRIKLGMGGLAEITADRQSLLSILASQIRHTVRIN